MERKSLMLWGALLFFIFVGAASAWWTPYDSPNLRCTYEIMNTTNVSICGNLTMGDTCAEGCTIRFMIIPNQSGYIYFWSSGLPFYFNRNVTINDTLTVNATVNVTGNLDMNKYNITGVDWMIVDNLINNSGGVGILVHANMNMTKHNITDVDFIFVNNVTGDEVWFHSGIIMEGYSITNASNVEATGNMTTEEYFFGPTIEGNLGSGVIWCDDIEDEANVNLTHTPGSLNIRYPNMTVRVVQSNHTVKYCNITSAWVAVTDEQHSIYYVDINCNVLSTSVDTYLATDLSPGGIADIFNAMAHSGDIEVHKGVTVKNKEDIKVRKNIFKSQHLDVISGIGRTEEDFPNLTIGEGEYMYIREIVNASEQNTSLLARVELVHHAGGSWAYNISDGLNLTYCDDGTNLVTPCTNPASYRRYYVFIIGWADADDHTEIHQLASDDGTTYANIGSCLDVDANPLSYTLPDHYTYAAVPIYVYCGRPNDADWTGSWIDLRTVRPGAATGEIDTSIFLTRDGTRTLIANWDAGSFNITAEAFLGDFFGDVFIGGIPIGALYIGIGNQTGNSSAEIMTVVNASDINTSGYLDAITLYVDGTALGALFIGEGNATGNTTSEIQAAINTSTVWVDYANDSGDSGLLGGKTEANLNVNASNYWDALDTPPSAWGRGNDTSEVSAMINTTTLWVDYANASGEATISRGNNSAEIETAVNDSNLAWDYPYNITVNYVIGNASHGLNEIECWGNATHPCHWCEYFNGTHKVEESPCTL